MADRRWSDREGHLLERAETPTDRRGLGAEGLFAALTGPRADPDRGGRGAALGARPTPAACGVGAAGPVDLRAGTVSPLNTPAWRDFPLRRRLAEATGLPTALDLDAKALALGEGWVGRGGRAARLPGTWWCRPAWAAGSCATGGCSTAPAATPATSAT